MFRRIDLNIYYNLNKLYYKLTKSDVATSVKITTQNNFNLEKINSVARVSHIKKSNDKEELERVQADIRF